MVEVAGAIKQKWREMRCVFAIEMLDHTRRRGKAKLRPPLCCIEALERNFVAIPGAIEVDMQRGRQRISTQRRRRNGRDGLRPRKSGYVLHELERLVFLKPPGKSTSASRHAVQARLSILCARFPNRVRS